MKTNVEDRSDATELKASEDKQKDLVLHWLITVKLNKDRLG